MDLKCNHCESTDMVMETKGSQTGLYCCNCGKWIKWLSKDEIRAFNHKKDRAEFTENLNSTLNLSSENVGIGFRIIATIGSLKFASYKIFETEEEAIGYIEFLKSQVI